MKHNPDIICSFMSYLSAHDISRCVVVCRSWYNACDFGFYRRLFEKKQSPSDFGKGCSVRFDIGCNAIACKGQLCDWRRIIGAKSLIDRCQISNIDHSFDRVLSILFCCYAHRKNHSLQLEGWRQITTIFDAHENRERFVAPQITDLSFLRRLVRGVDSRDLGEAQIAAKLIGVLCDQNETNRAHLSRLGAIPKLLRCLIINVANTELVACILWSLVVLGRPIGAVEAQRYQVEDREKFLCNILEMRRLGIIDNLTRVTDTHSQSPLILAKVFWLMVNLSLLEEIKVSIVASGALSVICAAMRRFSEDKEVIYRAVFSIVNLGICEEAKHKLLAQNGVELVLDAVRRFPDDVKLLSMCIFAIRSMCSQCQPIATQFAANKVAQMLVGVARRHENLRRPVTTTMDMFNFVL